MPQKIASLVVVIVVLNKIYFLQGDVNFGHLKTFLVILSAVISL